MNACLRCVRFPEVHDNFRSLSSDFKIPCFDCAQPLLRNQKTLRLLYSRNITNSTIQDTGRRCRNELRHVACGIFDDFRFIAIQDTHKREKKASKQKAIVSHRHDCGPQCPAGCVQYKTLHTKRKPLDVVDDALDEGDQWGAMDEDISSPPPTDSVPNTTQRSLPYTPQEVGQESGPDTEADMLISHGVRYLQTVFQGRCPGHIPVHSTCNGLFFLLPSTLTTRMQDEISFSRDSRRPVYLHLLKVDQSSYFVCSVHTLPGRTLPHRIPGTQSITVDPDCHRLCTCWHAFLLYFAGIKHMVLTYSTRNDLISDLERTSIPWIRREDYANTALGSHSRNIWAPQHPPHTFDVCLVHHKLARRFWMSAGNVLCISKDIERTEQEVHTYSVSHVRVSCGSQVGELGTPACGLVLSFNHERGVCTTCNWFAIRSSATTPRKCSHWHQLFGKCRSVIKQSVSQRRMSLAAIQSRLERRLQPDGETRKFVGKVEQRFPTCLVN